MRSRLARRWRRSAASSATAIRKRTSGVRPALVFNNQRIPIDKDQFIIGRGSKSSDLAIKDGNISRKHAAVIRRNGGRHENAAIQLDGDDRLAPAALRAEDAIRAKGGVKFPVGLEALHIKRIA